MLIEISPAPKVLADFRIQQAADHTVQKFGKAKPDADLFGKDLGLGGRQPDLPALRFEYRKQRAHTGIDRIFVHTALAVILAVDLNGRNSAWSTTSAFTSGANTVLFASGATITVDVSTRPTFKGKIVDWGAGNTPSDVTFKLDAASKAMGRALRVKDDGLYAVGGMMIIIR